MKIYLAGPMSGIPHFNYPAFHTAAYTLRKQGHEVFSPAEADTTEHGSDISLDNLTGSVEQAAKDYGFSRRKAMHIDTTYICTQADAIALLPGWERSEGSMAEWAVAKFCKLKFIYL